MTPLEFADHLRKDFESYASEFSPPVGIPEMSYSKMGEPVIACGSLIVATTDLAAQPLFDNIGGVCGYIQVGTFLVALSRDCAYEMNDDGTDNVEEVVEISKQTDHDGDCLWSWALSIDPYMTKDFSLGFAITGGLAISSLQLTLGVP
jgi:hypothetical protein